MTLHATSPDSFVAGRAAAPSRSHALMTLLPVLAVVFAAAIFLVDTFVMIDIAVAVLYVAVVLLSVSFCRRRGIIAVSAVCMVLTVVSYLVQHSYFVQHLPDGTRDSLGRGVVSLLAIAITTLLAVRIQSTTAKLGKQARLLDLTHDAIFVCDMNSRILYWNRGAEQLYGWSAKEAVGKTTHSLWQANFSKPYKEIMAELLRNGHWEGELIDAKRDGSKVTVASRWSLQRDEHGQPVAILETNTDIEETKQAQETLAKAQADLTHVSRISTLGELTASIAHEVNQPLAAIVTSGEACLRWLDRDEPKLDSVKRGIARMIGDGQRASEVVRRLRALSKKDDLQKAPINVNEVIDDAILLVQREVTTHRVRLRLDLTASLPAVLGNRVQLQQVIINLMMNAIQAMAAAGNRRELSVRSLRHGGGQVLVAVCDTGPGFDAGSEGQLFTAFFTTKADGMGMGLSICRSIIEAHGGRVWASRNADGGATFQFALSQHVEQPS